MSEEGNLKKTARIYLKRLGAYRFSPVQMGYGAATIDDLCCIHGRFVGIEYKTKGRKPTPRQELCMKEIIAAGGAAFWCDSMDSFLRNLSVWGLDGEMKDERFLSRSAKQPSDLPPPL
jgi:hypothetical protein